MTLTIFIMVILAFVFLIGTCVGSFLNVVVLRAFSEESICFPGSKCPSCQKPLKWYHNIPILSFLILKGKCAFCKDEISVQYPVIELATGVFFLLAFLKFGLTLNALFILIFGSLFIVIAATDIREKVVFDVHTYIIVAMGLVYNFFNIGNLYLGMQMVNLGIIHFGVNNSFLAALVGVVAGIIIMEAFARFGYLVAGTRAFGEGDTYIAAGLGAIFGTKYLLTVLAYSFIIQILFTIPVFVKKLFKNRDIKTLVAFLIFFALVILLKYLDYATASQNMLIFAILSLFLCGIGIYLCLRILRGLKDKSDMTYLPFGPAMVTGAIVLIFIN